MRRRHLFIAVALGLAFVAGFALFQAGRGGGIAAMQGQSPPPPTLPLGRAGATPASTAAVPPPFIPGLVVTPGIQKTPVLVPPAVAQTFFPLATVVRVYTGTPTIEVQTGRPIGTPVPEPTVDPNCLTPLPVTDAWSTYTMPDGGFSFEYPTGWTVTPLPMDQKRWGMPGEENQLFIENLRRNCRLPMDSSPFYHLVFRAVPGAMRNTSNIEAVAQMLTTGEKIRSFESSRVDGRPAARVIVELASTSKTSALGSLLFFARRETAYVLVEPEIKASYSTVIDRVIRSIRLS